MAVAEMKNSVVIEGILSEIGLEKGNYTKDGTTYDVIRGEVKVRVVTPLARGEEPTELEVPARFFVKKLTNSGNENPAYTRLEDLMANGKSIAAVGEAEADCVRITGARVVMQEYYTPDGRFITFPSVSASFINVIKRADMVMKAKFDCEMVIGKMGMQTDKDGVETDTMQITGVVVGYGEYTDIIPFITSNPQYIAGIQASYQENDTVELAGNLNFSSRTETTYEEVEIGEPIEHTRTVNVSDLIISSIKPREVSAEDYDPADIKACLSKRTARLEALKEKAEARAKGGRNKEIEKKKVDLGF